MKQEKVNTFEQPKNKVAIFPTISNPPTFGTIYLLSQIANKYDKIIVVVYDNPSLLTTKHVVKMLDMVLSKMVDNIVVMYSNVNFAHITIFPKDEKGNSVIKDKDIITTSLSVYTNLVNKGYRHVFLIQMPYGYNESFHRIAYSRSLILDRFKNIRGRLMKKW